MTATLKDQESFYDEYWTDRSIPLNAHELLRLGEILAELGRIVIYDQRRFSICDLGCGTGWLSNELRKFGPVFAVDLSKKGIALAAERWPGIEFEAQNILTWRPDRRFDLVVSSEVLEHIEDKQAFVETIDHLLKPGGYLVLTTPNERVKKQWDAAGQGKQILEQWVGPRSLRRLLRRRWTVLSHRTFLHDFCYVGIFRVLSAPKLLAALRKLRLWHAYNALRSLAGLGLYQIVVCQKR